MNETFGVLLSKCATVAHFALWHYDIVFPFSGSDNSLPT